MSQRQLPARPDREHVPAAPEDANVFVSWVKELYRQARLAWGLFWDRRVPWAIKLIPPAALIYLISPIDLIPDFGLGLGQLDDLAVILLGFKLFIELAPADVVREHLRALGARIGQWDLDEEQPVVEGEFTVEGEKREEEQEE